jgi:hypothetical protein
MESRIDIYGRTIYKTIENNQEIYTCDGVKIIAHIGHGWDNALRTCKNILPASLANKPSDLSLQISSTEPEVTPTE